MKRRFEEHNIHATYIIDTSTGRDVFLTEFLFRSEAHNIRCKAQTAERHARTRTVRAGLFALSRHE